MPENQETYVLGYILDYPDQTSHFVPIFEGTFVKVAKINLEKISGETEFHGNRPIHGAKWEIRKAEDVSPDVKAS